LDFVLIPQPSDCMSLFTHGTAVFYLPQFPFSGEIEASNMLTFLDSIKHYEKIGWVSPLHNVVVVTPNDRIVSHSDLLNDYFTMKLEQYGVEVRYNTTMNSINKGIYFFC
jgi:sulfide:quinone oxidoreductase